MDDSNFPIDPNISMDDVVSALQNMRDALVELSLAMNDYRFAYDNEKRIEAEGIFQSTFEKSKNQPS